QVVIIGASSGIGRSLAHIYSERGGSVLLFARRKDHLEDVKMECQSLGQSKGKIITVVGDIRNETDILAARNRAEEEFNGCDTLVLCAGVIATQPFETLALNNEIAPEMSSNAIASIFEINTTGPIQCTKVIILTCSHFLSALISSNGRIIVVSSLAGVLGGPTRALYASTKFALTGFFNSLRVELARYGISVTLAMPATVDTSLRASAIDSIFQNSQENGTTPMKADHNPDHAKVKLKKLSTAECAKYIVRAGDDRERSIFIPWWYSLVVIAATFFPSLVDKLASVKYNY
ncbi:hypothetical protein BJ742DRAFT_891651, partial [Cladochytrium replicatum]